MNDWTLEDSLATYNIRHWGDGYFDINGMGEVVVHPDGVSSHRAVPLSTVIGECERQGLRLPTLVRFSGILRNRVRRLRDAFCDVIKDLEYQGAYIPVFPIKVNQQRRVVEEVISVNERVRGRQVGLEAGSKPELMAVLALLRAGDMVVCNGYKDREYIRLALLGEKLGLKVTIVVEKLSELDIILEESAKIGVLPRIGVRVRLWSTGRGNWQNTGGEKSKFGLSPLQVLELVARTRAVGRENCVELLHFHLGSQVANIQDIKAGLREAARFYVELRKMGVPVQCIDVGGGLSVDYEGTRSRSHFSMNYGLRDYAWHIVQTVRDLCDENEVPHPDIASESGRAITAHHAVLITNVSDIEQVEDSTPEKPREDAPTIVDELWALHQWLRDGGPDFNVLEAWHDVMNAYQDAITQFIHEGISLLDRAWCERAYHACCRLLRKRLDPRRRKQRELLDALNEKMADKLFLNFSVFQSTPDVWGIDQVFPILPLERLDERPDSRAVIQDITCDSDGRIERYVDGEGLESTLPLPPWDPARPYHIGIFLIGAYQEILGDMHNLFGDTDSCDVEVDPNGKIVIENPIRGDTVSSVLRYVNFNPESILLKLSARLDEAQMPHEERAGYLTEVREGLEGYTYLE
jgi:arginine decarboxylase